MERLLHNDMKNQIKRISHLAVAMTMAAAMTVPAFAAAPDDLYVTDGGSTSFGGAFGSEIKYDPEYRRLSKRPPRRPAMLCPSI